MNLSADTIIQIVGFAILVYLVARARPVPTPNGSALTTILNQLSVMTAERDKWKAEADGLRAACSEQQKDLASLQRALREAQKISDMNRAAR